MVDVEVTSIATVYAIMKTSSDVRMKTQNNYNTEATADDGSCIYNEVCVGDLFEDGYITIQDLMILLAVYGTTCE